MEVEETKGDDSLPSTGELELDEMLEVDDNEIICHIQRGVESFGDETEGSRVFWR